MIKSETLRTILADITKAAKLKKEQYIESAKNIAFVEGASGVKLCSRSWDFEFDRNRFNIKESDKIAICKVVGTFDEVVGKMLAGDFKKTNEILITVNAKTGIFREMQFTYRRLLLENDDCQVETVQHEGTDGWESKRLVCTVR